MSAETHYIVINHDGDDDGSMEYANVEDAIAEAKSLGLPAVKARTATGSEQREFYVWPVQVVVP